MIKITYFIVDPNSVWVVVESPRAPETGGPDACVLPDRKQGSLWYDYYTFETPAAAEAFAKSEMELDVAFNDGDIVGLIRL